MSFEHKPVMLYECVDALRIKPDGVYVDCTLGGAGHSLAICKKLSSRGEVVCIDKDINAIQNATNIMQMYSDRAVIVHSSFFKIKELLQSLQIPKADGFLLDLGVSSHQLDEPSRGFSYMNDAPLDMRMDVSQPLSAFHVVNEYGEAALCQMIAEYGEERWAKRIAEFIVSERTRKPIRTTLELVSVIKKAVPKAAREENSHPAKRTFQAIRIEVNEELEPLGKALSTMVSLLNPGGRICVITFHSLEDRIVKNSYRDLENPCKCPPDIPYCVCGKTPLLKIITRKPILPSEQEIETNRRAHSAKLRVAEKL